MTEIQLPTLSEVLEMRKPKSAFILFDSLANRVERDLVAVQDQLFQSGVKDYVQIEHGAFMNLIGTCPYNGDGSNHYWAEFDKYASNISDIRIIVPGRVEWRNHPENESRFLQSGVNFFEERSHTTPAVIPYFANSVSPELELFLESREPEIREMYLQRFCSI